jgi:hypothetical protein
MQKRSCSARRINVTEKPARLSGFSFVQSCISQPEQNETDEPPSLFKPLNACIGLYGQSRINTRHLRYVIPRSLLFFSKMRKPKEVKDFFFSRLVSGFTAESVQFRRINLRQSVDCFGELKEEGFIVRDNRGRIKTIVYCKKRST